MESLTPNKEKSSLINESLNRKKQESKSNLN